VKWGAKAASSGRASSGRMVTVPSLVGGHEKSVQLPMLPVRAALQIGISPA